MVFGFLLAWSPYAAFSAWIFMNKGAAFSPLSAAVCAFFAKSSALYNPVIYVLMNKQVGSFESFSNSGAQLYARLYIDKSLALFFSSVTACWAQLEWVAQWMMRPRCLPARQRCLLCLKCREISLLPGHFPYYWHFDLEQSPMWNEWSSEICRLPKEQCHQEQNEWTEFFNLLFERSRGKCLSNLSHDFKILKNNANIAKHIFCMWMLT